MKLSKYVRTIRYDNNKMILTNSVNDAVFLVSKADFIKLKEGDFQLLSTKLVEGLTKNGFFMTDSKVQQVIDNRDQYDNKTLTITVNMTEGCNLNCDYCYENEFEEYQPISKQTIDQIVDYIGAVFKQTSKNRLVIYFFGGEPTTRRDRMLYLKEKVDNLQEKYNFALSYKIGSNGVLLKKPLVEKFSHLTIDLALSNKEDHDHFRTFKNGNRTYDIIMKNLREIRPLIMEGRVELNFRFNTNEKNIKHFDEFVSAVTNLQVPCSILPAYTDNYPYNHYYNKLDKEYYREWVSTTFVNTLIKYKQPIYLSSNLGASTKCRAYEPYSIKFFSDGAIALCDATDFYERKHIPLKTIIDNPNKVNEIYHQYKGKSNKAIDKCHGCPLLFNCLGDLYCNQDGCVEETDMNYVYFIRNYVEQCLNGNKQYFVAI